MTNPYRALPDQAFWRRAVSGVPAHDMDPVVEAPFRIGRDDKIATAGSCFAQHISRTLRQLGFHYLVTETATPGREDQENYGVFPARFGNIYSVRQLLQTFDRAYGLFRPLDLAWTRADGALADPFRPQIRKAGFADEDALKQDRKRHLACVREMFEDCDIFIFTLGLTETWRSTRDGAVFPLAPGVSGGEPGDNYEFNNLSVEEMTADLRAFIGKLKVVNPGVRIILTVSPVPLIATYEPRHVLVSNTYSKAALRVVAETVCRAETDVCYFPSYEIITGAHAGGRYFAEDLRSVTPEGVDHVMRLFSRHFLTDAVGLTRPAALAKAAAVLSAEDQERLGEQAELVCDEEAIDP